MRAAYERLGKDPTATRAMWIKAAADYYVALHPDEATWRSTSVPDGLPSVDDIRARAEVANRAHKAVPRTGRIDPDPKRRDVWAAQVGWAEETHRAVLTQGFWAAMSALNAGDPSDLRRWLLASTSARGLYQRLGFTPLPAPERFMQIDTRASAGAGTEGAPTTGGGDLSLR